jgi:hypothetical protein
MPGACLATEAERPRDVLEKLTLGQLKGIIGNNLATTRESTRDSAMSNPIRGHARPRARAPTTKPASAVSPQVM